jgi:hypothetical protein
MKIGSEKSEMNTRLVKDNDNNKEIKVTQNTVVCNQTIFLGRSYLFSIGTIGITKYHW